MRIINSMNKILVINTGSTSTKIAVYLENLALFEETINHSKSDLAKFETVKCELEWRKSIILDKLDQHSIDLKNIVAIASRGGITRPISGGTYEINEKMLSDIESINDDAHPTNLAPTLSYQIAKENNIKAYVVDPVVVDELSDIARVSGVKGIERASIFHALNQKAVAYQLAFDLKRNYDELNLIIAHLGGGISIGAHKGGKVVDVNNGLDGEGPFSTNRCGGLPVADVIKLCFCGLYTEDTIFKKIRQQSGMLDYLGTNDFFEIEKKCLEGDEKFNFYLDAMCYQTAKYIGSLSVIFEGKLDAIVLTGGLARVPIVVDKIKKMVSFLASVHVYPGEREMLALALGVLRALKGKEEVKNYK